jgi:hypothetical protein
VVCCNVSGLHLTEDLAAVTQDPHVGPEGGSPRKRASRPSGSALLQSRDRSLPMPQDGCSVGTVRDDAELDEEYPRDVGRSSCPFSDCLIAEPDHFGRKRSVHARRCTCRLRKGGVWVTIGLQPQTPGDWGDVCSS